MTRSEAAIVGWEKRRFSTTCAQARSWLTKQDKAQRPGCIYRLRNIVNGKGYVGQALYFEVRWKGHLDAAFKHNSQYPIHRAMRKYGKEAFSRKIIHSCLECELNDAEISRIKKLKTHVSQGGYNVTWGGDGVRGLEFSKKSIRRMSEAAKAYFVAHPEARAAVSKRMKGKTLTTEHRQKIAESSKGRRHKKKSKLTMAEQAKLRWANPVYRANQTAAQERRKADPEKIAAISLAASLGAKKRYERPEERARSGRVAKKHWRKAGMKAKMRTLISAGMQEVIITPEYRQKMSDNRKGKAALVG